MFHTVAWAVFALCILAIPAFILMDRVQDAAGLSVLVWVEVFVLAANRMRCLLTALARRYTEDQTDNFDIFLPEWLARHNKTIFGSLFVAGEALLAWKWVLST
jgi:hypothetical protein